MMDEKTDAIIREEVLKALPEQWEHDAEHLYLKRFNDKSAAAAFSACAAQLRRVLGMPPRDWLSEA
jgi:hypothetical protein